MSQLNMKNVDIKEMEDLLEKHSKNISELKEVKLACSILKKKNINTDAFILLYTLTDGLVSGYCNQLEEKLSSVKNGKK